MTVVTAEMEDWTLPYIKQGRAEGRLEGKLEGERIGRHEGRIEGERIGEAKGEAQERIQVVYRMLAEGFEDGLISKLANVPLIEVQRLRLQS